MISAQYKFWTCYNADNLVRTISNYKELSQNRPINLTIKQFDLDRLGANSALNAVKCERSINRQPLFPVFIRLESRCTITACKGPLLHLMYQAEVTDWWWELTFTVTQDRRALTFKSYK